MMPAAFSKASALKRAGSATPNSQIETPHHTIKMQILFSRIQMPNFYKVDKMTYSRSDIADIGLRLGKRLDDLEHMVDFERRKNDFTTKEKIQL